MAADDAVAAAPVAASDADPTAPLSPIEMWRQIEQDHDSKTTLPVEPVTAGGARFEIEMRYCSIGWSVPASYRDAKGLDWRPTGAWFG